MQRSFLPRPTPVKLAIPSAATGDSTVVQAFNSRKPVRAPLLEHLPRQRVVIPAPTTCPCCGGKLSKLGETITESLQSIPRQWKVVQTVREKFTCRSCEAITSDGISPPYFLRHR